MGAREIVLNEPMISADDVLERWKGYTPREFVKGIQHNLDAELPTAFLFIGKMHNQGGGISYRYQEFQGIVEYNKDKWNEGYEFTNIYFKLADIKDFETRHPEARQHQSHCQWAAQANQSHAELEAKLAEQEAKLAAKEDKIAELTAKLEDAAAGDNQSKTQAAREAKTDKGLKRWLAVFPAMQLVFLEIMNGEGKEYYRWDIEKMLTAQGSAISTSQLDYFISTLPEIYRPKVGAPRQ